MKIKSVKIFDTFDTLLSPSLQVSCRGRIQEIESLQGQLQVTAPLHHIKIFQKAPVHVVIPNLDENQIQTQTEALLSFAMIHTQIGG